MIMSHIGFECIDGRSLLNGNNNEPKKIKIRGGLQHTVSALRIFRSIECLQ
jgi:hypothetical protein